MSKPNFIKVLEDDAFIPSAWKSSYEGECFAFNPSITISNGKNFLLAYRVSTSKAEFRKIATCLLNEKFELIKNSVVAFSDKIIFAEKIKENLHRGFNKRAFEWHADPRIFKLKGELYLLWNDGSNAPYNNQFLTKIDNKGVPLEPARVVVITNKYRRRTEKNWMFFESEGEIYAEYSSAFPIRSILKVDLDSSNSSILCEDCIKINQVDDTYEKLWGQMRGSAGPILYTGKDQKKSFISIDHSKFKIGPGKTNYEACAHEFEAEFPFNLKAKTESPIYLRVAHAEEERLLKNQLNPEISSVVYPCGSLIFDENLIISYGINDEKMGIAKYNLEEFKSCLKKCKNIDNDTEVESNENRSDDNELKIHSSYLLEKKSAHDNLVPCKPSIDLFWWNCEGKSFDKHTTRKWEVGNFGDIASKYIIEEVFNVETKQVKASSPSKLLSTGSILQNAKNNDIVWGSGLKGRCSISEEVKNLEVYAVRGPLTFTHLWENNIDVSKITEFFDPGCLVGYLFKKYGSSKFKVSNLIKKPTDFAIVAHYSDDLFLRRRNPQYSNNFVSVDCCPSEMVAKIIGSELVISTSLHGIIFAESLGIPAVWLRTDINSENEYKYYDYYFGTERTSIKYVNSIEEALSCKPMVLPKHNFEKYISTFPIDRLTTFFNTAVEKFPAINLSFAKKSIERSRFKNSFDFPSENFIEGGQGYWMTTKKGTFFIDCNSLGKGVQNTQFFELTLTFKPYNPETYEKPQSIILNIEDQYIKYVWEKGAQNDIKAIFPVKLDFKNEDRLLPVSIEANNCTSIFDTLGVGTLKTPLSIQIKDVLISRTNPAGEEV